MPEETAEDQKVILVSDSKPYPVVSACLNGYWISGFHVASGADYHVIAQTVEVTGHARDCKAIPKVENGREVVLWKN